MYVSSATILILLCEFVNPEIISIFLLGKENTSDIYFMRYSFASPSTGSAFIFMRSEPSGFTEIWSTLLLGFTRHCTFMNEKDQGV